MDFTRRTFTADDGAKLAVWDSRKGETPVVFVHGFPETHICWNPLFSALTSGDIRDYRLITYDLRGFGESSKTGEASLNRFFYDHQTIISKLRLKKYHLVGHDWGGAIALHTARFKPEKLRSLSIMNTNYWKTDLFGMWHLLFFNIPFLPKTVFGMIPESVFNFGMMGAFVNKESLSPKAREEYLRMFRDHETTRYWIKLYHNMGRIIMGNVIPFSKKLISFKETAPPARSDDAYQMDIDLIWGEDDRFNPPWVCIDMEKQLQKRRAHVSVHMIADAGHFVHEEQPGQVASCLLKKWKNGL